MMKNKLFYVMIIIVFLFTINGVFAIGSDLKNNYNSEETIITQIKGNILENIEKTRVEFRRGHVAVPLEFDIQKIEGKYYLWFISPKSEGNYSLIIKDIFTSVRGVTKEVNFEHNFTITENKTKYNIKPGFIIANKDFEVTLFSFLDEDLEIPVSYLGESTNKIIPGKNKLKFSIESFKEKNLIDIKIGDYTIPALILGREQSINAKENLPKLRFRPRVIESTVLKNDKDIFYPFEILSKEEGGVNLVFDYNKDLFNITPEKAIIRNNEIIEFNLTLKGMVKDNIKEIVYARYGNKFIALPININLTEIKNETATPYLEKNFNEVSLYYCSELNGVECSENEVCEGDDEQSLDGICCVGVCKEPKKDFGWGTVIGWILGLIVIAIVGIVFAKYKKAKIPKNKKFNEKVKIAEKKLDRRIP